ncbi:MAG TPA: ABC transporter ATP-binding protein [Candidatus Omnitrophota bacterium]|nr:ABC transporter ATP-binding protein [Candidatus Omnitrophota bacterium]HRY85116.1 ABC transporter ATP-binding protein [Candidatus Omnitrophota bacterium]
MNAVEWRDVSFQYGSAFHIDSFSCSLEEGSMTLFLGENGAGKTTLFKLALGWLRPRSGKTFLFENPVERMNALEIARKAAYLEQDAAYIFPFTVEELVLMGRFPNAPHGFWNRKEDLERAAWAMEATDTLRFAKRSILQLSGGERRRVEIARAICQQAKILLLDEPVSNLDIRQQIGLFELLTRLQQREKLTVAVISHQWEWLKPFLGRVVMLRSGKMAATGPAGEFLRPERIAEFFSVASHSTYFKKGT